MGNDNLLDLEAIKDAPVSPATAIAAVALNFAMKWYDMTTIKDGAMYQQKKLEGANFQYYDFPDVLERAKEIELWILGSPSRLSQAVLEVIADELAEGVSNG